MRRWVFFDQTTKAPISAKFKEIKVGTIGITTKKVTMFEIETKTATTTSIRVTMVTEMIGMGPMFHLKIGKFLLGMVEVVWRELRVCWKR